MLHKCNVENLPTFCACDLSRIPPVDVSCIDLTSMLKEFSAMRKEFSEMRINFRDIKSNRDGTQVHHVDPTTWPTPGSANEARDDTPAQICPIDQPRYVEIPPVLPRKKLHSVHHNTHSTTTVRPDVHVAPHTDNDGFQVVMRKKRHPVIGTSTQSSRLKVVKGRHASVFLSRLSPDTTTDEIVKYAKDHLKLTIKCNRLTTKYDTYASFKVDTQCNDTELLFNPGSWPEDILVRKFFVKKNN